MLGQEHLTLPEIRAKIRRWCAYQDRSQAETRSRLQALGLSGTWLDEELGALVLEGFVSDARFASAYVRGHLAKGWGRHKLAQGLQAAGIPDHLIERTLTDEIDEATYRATLAKLVAKKLPTVVDPNPVRRAFKVARYLEQKGYSRQEARTALAEAGLGTP